VNAIFCFRSPFCVHLQLDLTFFTHILGSEQIKLFTLLGSPVLCGYWYWHGVFLNPISWRKWEKRHCYEEHENSVWCVWESPGNSDLLRRWGSFVCQMWCWSSCCKQACKQASEASSSMFIKQASQMWHMSGTYNSSLFFYFYDIIKYSHKSLYLEGWICLILPRILVCVCFIWEATGIYRISNTDMYVTKKTRSKLC